MKLVVIVWKWRKYAGWAIKSWTCLRLINQPCSDILKVKNSLGQNLAWVIKSWTCLRLNNQPCSDILKVKKL